MLLRNWVMAFLAPRPLVGMFAPLRVEGFALVDDAGRYRDPAPIESARALKYGCGMFEFSKAA